MQILFNIAPMRMSDTDRHDILQAYPGAAIEIIPGEASINLDEYDGAMVDVIVGEALPNDLSRWPKLKFVQLLAAGTDYLAGHPIWSRNIPISSARGIHSVPIAEYIISNTLQLVHDMSRAAAFGRSWDWPKSSDITPRTLRGLTVGIVGYGAVGRESARQFNQLGVRVLAMKGRPEYRDSTHYEVYPGTGDPSGSIPQTMYGPADIDHMLPNCDVLVITAAKTPATIGLIAAAQLKRLPRGAIVIVTSRGGIVDEQALADALNSGHLSGAAVDTYSTEPVAPNNPLRNAVNLIATPHVAGVFDRYYSMVNRILCENLLRHREDRDLVNLASK